LAVRLGPARQHSTTLPLGSLWRASPGDQVLTAYCRSCLRRPPPHPLQAPAVVVDLGFVPGEVEPIGPSRLAPDPGALDTHQEPVVEPNTSEENVFSLMVVRGVFSRALPTTLARERHRTEVVFVTPNAQRLFRWRGGLTRLAKDPGGLPTRSVSEQSARELLAEAHTAMARQASIETRSGRVEQGVLAATEQMDLLIMARDGDRPHPGPHSLGPTGRFVVEHAPFAVLLVWPTDPRSHIGGTPRRTLSGRAGRGPT